MKFDIDTFIDLQFDIDYGWLWELRVLMTRWWFQIFYICTPKIGGEFPFWLIFFQWGWFNHQLEEQMSTEAWCRGPLMGTVDHGGPKRFFETRRQKRWKHHRQRVTSGMKYYIVANTLYFIQIDCPWCYHFRKRLESRSSRPMQWLFLHATRQRSVVGIDMKIDRFRLSKARQDGKMRLRLLKILDSCYIHSTIDQPTILRLKAGRSCQGDQCPHLCGNHVHQQIHHS